MKNAIRRMSALPVAGPYPTLDPFLFCVYHKDDYPPDESPDGRSMEALFPGNGSDFDPDKPYRMYHGRKVPGFPRHPHRGFETITATMTGSIDHADSTGNAGRYGRGDVQWMTAGRGVQHSEMFPLVNADEPNPTRFFQIWLNLPSRKKMVEPGFAMIWAENVHVWKSDDGLASVTVWAGNDAYFGGASARAEGSETSPPPDSWASDPDNDVAVLHMAVERGGSVVVPGSTTEGVRRTMYLIEGYDNEVKVDGVVVREKSYLELDASKDVSIEVSPSNSGVNDDGSLTQQPTEFLLLQGRAIDEPVVQHGPFVMNTREEIRDAFSDYQRTQFGGWPWERDDMVFPRERGRFALIDLMEVHPPGNDGGAPREGDKEL